MRAATTLCALHYLVCTLSMWTTQGLGLVKRVDIPFKGESLPEERVLAARGSGCAPPMRPWASLLVTSPPEAAVTA